jgi:hypothetical protein
VPGWATQPRRTRSLAWQVMWLVHAHVKHMPSGRATMSRTVPTSTTEKNTVAMSRATQVRASLVSFCYLICICLILC